jgi:imidazolonepropionase-like amidohydrolase
MMSNSTLALVGGRLIDGTGREPVPRATVVVEGRAISQVGPADEIDVPEGCQVIDCTGKTMMPGMIDCHCHVSLTTMDIKARLLTRKTVQMFRTAKMMERILHAGFTTVREPGILNDVGFREAVELGLVEGPRLVLAGGIGQTGGHFDEYYARGVAIPLYGVLMADGVPEVQKAARRVLREGFDFIKICTTGGVISETDHPEYTQWTMEELRAMVYEARARDKAVMAHAEGTQGIKNAIRAGVWSVEHGSLLDEEGIHMLLDSGTYLVPTLYALDALVERGDELNLTPAALRKVDAVGHRHVESFREALAAGVKIAVGTDIIDEREHGKNARELTLMVRHGATPMQAVVAATRTAAEACRVDDQVGTLEAGKLADVLVVDGNPLDDIAILEDQSALSLVMKEGAACVDRVGAGS